MSDTSLHSGPIPVATGCAIIDYSKIHSMKLTGSTYILNSCNCIGRQRNEPMCPCQMRAMGIYQRDGRWIRPELDLGPV